MGRSLRIQEQLPKLFIVLNFHHLEMKTFYVLIKNHSSTWTHDFLSLSLWQFFFNNFLILVLGSTQPYWLMTDPLLKKWLLLQMAKFPVSPTVNFFLPSFYCELIHIRLSAASTSECSLPSFPFWEGYEGRWPEEVIHLSALLPPYLHTSRGFGEILLSA